MKLHYTSLQLIYVKDNGTKIVEILLKLIIYFSLNRKRQLIYRPKIQLPCLDLK